MNMNRSLAVKLGLSGALCSCLPPGLFAEEPAEPTDNAADPSETAESIETAELPFGYSFADIQDNMAVIQITALGRSESSCGFIMMMQGRPYLITTQHALLGAERFSFTSPAGREIKPRRVELSADSDIVRLELADGSGFVSGGKPAMGERVAVFGSTESNSAPDGIYGAVNGIGADIIEISAPFETDNSGCPVLNADGEVLAMASYTRESSGHIMKMGTRFENRTRRFCRRLNDVPWKAVNWKKFNAAFGRHYLNCRIMLDDISQILNSWSEGPLEQVTFEGKPQKKLAKWLENHNTIVARSVDIGKGRRQFYTDYSKSAAALSKQCRTLSHEIYLLSEQRGLTDFLIDEFESYGAVFNMAADIIDRYGSSTY